MLMVTLAALATGLIMDASVLTEVRGGCSSAQGQLCTTAGAEGEDPDAAILAGDLQARLPDPDGDLRFGLSPSVVLGRDRRELFARGFGELDLRIGKTGWARLRQGLGYGTIDLSALAPVAEAPPGAPVSVQSPPAARFVQIQESNTAVQMELSPSRRSRVLGSAAWVVSGGADAEARQSVPLGRGPQARASWQWSATRLDKVRFELGGADTRYSNDRRATVGWFLMGWLTQTSRSTELSFSAGPGIGRAHTGGQLDTTAAYAVATADLRATAWRDLSVAVGASLEPLGDPLSGVLVERTSARALVTLGKPGATTATALLLVSRVLTSSDSALTNPQPGDRYLRGEVGAVFPLDTRSTLGAGVRAAFLSRPLPGQPARQVAAFVRYSAQLPLLR